MANEIKIENNLFNEKKMEEYIDKYDDFLIVNNPDNTSIQDWIEKLNAGELENEKENYFNFRDIILTDLLGYDRKDMIFEHDVGETGRPVEFTLIKEDKEFAIIELKGSKYKDLHKKRNGQSPIEQATNYASVKEETKWAIVSNYDEFRLFNPSFNEKYISFKFNQLSDEKILKKFLLVFSKFSLIEQDIPRKLLRETRIIERELEEEFYQLYSETRLMLIKELEHSSEDIGRLEAIRLAQLILNRFIFLCFAEDIFLIPSETIADVLITPIKHKNLFEFTMWDRLNELFRFVDKGNEERGIHAFNGGLFADNLRHLEIRDKIDDISFFEDCRTKWTFNDKYEDIENLLGVYKDTLNPIYKNLLTISSFDFGSELSVNILGHIFENSISDIEVLKEDTTEKRKKDGVFYTPEYITDYICRNAILSFLSKDGTAKSIPNLIKEYESTNTLDELDYKLKNIKILDPACGSGSILNKAVDILLNIHEAYHNIKYSNDQSLNPFMDNLENRKQIISNNIFGVDLNDESVEITKLSLFLKLATTSGIKQGFKLPNLDKNIKCGNSLVNDKSIEEKSFNWHEEFKEIFDDGGFDIVVGNPPYVSIGKSKYSKEYKDYLKNNYETAFQKYDLYVLFMELSLNILKNEGELCYIVPFPLLNQDYGLKLRQLILNNCEIKEIFDLSDYKIFKDAEVRNIIITLKKNIQNNNNDNLIRIKKQINEPQILTSDFEYLKQDIFISTYQNMFRLELKDNNTYNLIKKLQKKSNKKLNDVVFTSWGARGTPIKEFHFDSKINDNCKRMIKGVNINRFSINYDNKWLNYDLDKLYRPSMVEFFEPEKIVVKKVSGKEGLIAAYDDNSYYTDDSLCCVTLKHNFKDVDQKILKKHKLILDDESMNNSLKYNLKYILAFINSNVTNFYFKNMIGYDLNVYPTNILELPFIDLTKDNQKTFIDLVDNILSSNQELINEIKSFHKWIKRTFKIDLSSNLENYYGNDFNYFIEELENKKINTKPRDIQELLEKEYDNSLSIINHLKNEIHKSEIQMNQLIYDLYDLTSEEIKIIENSLN